MTNEIILRPDKNRRSLESILAKQLADGRLPDSITAIPANPAITLMTPYYTRIRRSLDSIAEAIARQNNRPTWFDYKSIITKAKENNIKYIEEQQRAGMPIGLLRVGSAAKKAGYSTTIIDAVYEGWTQSELYFRSENNSEVIRYGLSRNQIEERLRQSKPAVVGITCDYTHQWGNARELADIIKSIDQNIVVVMGGTHVHGLPRDALLDSPIDYVVTRQGDKTFVELLDVLSGKSTKSIEEIDGIAYRKDNSVIENKKRHFITTLEDVALDYSFFNLNQYSGPFHSAGPRLLDTGYLVYFFATTGCNVGCKFCAIPGVQGGWTAQSEKTLDESLAYLSSIGVRELLIEDDHLFHDPVRARTVFQKLKKYDMTWFEEGGVSLFNLIALHPSVGEEEIYASVTNPHLFDRVIEAKHAGITTEMLIKEMASSGCYGAYLAVETPNIESLATSKKSTLNADGILTKEIVSLFKQYDMNVTCGLMYGFINRDGKTVYAESPKQIQNSFRFAKELRKVGASYINFFIDTPLPGAPNFYDLLPYASRNTDECYSHEFGTMNAPNGEWTRDELTLLRLQGIFDTIGVDGYKKMCRTGTWPT
ncbi:MAG: cobalamin-dependent protein [Candidatus Woesearchaeota archaeon]